VRIALVASERLPLVDPPGGPLPTYLAAVAPRLALWHQVTVISAAPPEGTSAAAADGVAAQTGVGGVGQPATWPGVEHNVLAAATLPEYRDAVVTALAALQPDVVHLFNRPSLARAVRAALPGVGVVLGLHNLFARMPDPLLCSGLLSATGVVTISRFVGSEFERRCPALAQRWQAVYAGVDGDLFVPGWSPAGAPLRSAVRHRLGLEHEPIVLFAGRLVATKGPQVLLAAMEQVWQRFPDAVLVLAGGRVLSDSALGEWGAALQARAQAMGGRVLFPGWLPPTELRRWFAAADVLVCPSQWPEPLARVLYEGMAAGLPLVVSSRGGNAEVVDDGKNGLLVRDWQNPRAYALAIRRLLANASLRRYLGGHGRTRALQQFAWDRVAADLEGIYQRVSTPHDR
jgi:spore coat protein SA